MGTSPSAKDSGGVCRDHPHAYGDKVLMCYKHTFLTGSSPRVWGQDVYQKYDGNQPGIIPTRMGTRVFWFCSGCYAEDHPHAYGDKLYFGIISCILVGSSPRVWGQAQGAAVFFRDDGIIPTRMGTSGLRSFAFWVVKDHPHAYGDK